MAISKFLADNGTTYINEAAHYLEARGVTIQDLPILPYKNTNLGFFVKEGAGFQPIVTEGWAFKIRHPEGEYYDDRWLLRVMNWPSGDLFQKRQGKMVQVTGAPPKFVQIGPKGADCTNFISTIDELCHSNIVVFHEKFTSAAITARELGLPSLALSGCTNWSQGGRLKDNIEKVIRLMKPNANLVVCFDGDILLNPNVMTAASQLSGWVHTIRKDIKVTFPLVPPMEEGLNGFDDWMVQQGEDLQMNFLALIEGGGVDVVSALPIQYLISEYQVKVKIIRDRVVIEHTAQNYARLLRHPLWENYIMDVDFNIYDRNDIGAGFSTLDQFYDRYEMWLADSVFVGDGASVRGLAVKQAVRQVLFSRMESIPLLLLGSQPPVTLQQAREAAQRLVHDGIRVTGPMQPEETTETLIRIARDMVSMWSTDTNVDVQWVLALVGPSGCGKSNFPHSFLRCFKEWGYEPSVSQLAKDGSRANLDELYRQCRDSLVGVFDEYNPDERSARQIEQNLFTLSSSRTFKQRQLHNEFATGQLRRASLMLTTVNRNRAYIRSAKDAGERRFITMDVEGVKKWGGRLSSDRDVVAQCGATLLTYGYQLFMEGDTTSATEFSDKYTSQYISEAPICNRIAALWARQDMMHALGNFRNDQTWKDDGSVRFSLPQLQDVLMPGEKLSRLDRADFLTFICECGAKDIGQSRVATPSGITMKDKAFSIKDWDAWALELRARLS